ncbi:hypothetical protein L7F22_047193 [Adiantum nelumboides]|nr:hypothetical protein [Adiantum nelumboides]
MADTDLTSTILKYTDRHLGFPLLQHLGSLDIFNQDDIAKAMFELAKGTSMVDFALQLHQQAYPDEPAPVELQTQREDAEAQNERLASEVETVLNVIEDPTVADSLKQDKAQNLQWLEEHYNLTLDQINALYRYGYFQYSCGNYGEASSYLYHFRVLSTDPVLTVSSHWASWHRTFSRETGTEHWRSSSFCAILSTTLVQTRADTRLCCRRGPGCFTGRSLSGSTIPRPRGTGRNVFLHAVPQHDPNDVLVAPPLPCHVSDRHPPLLPRLFIQSSSSNPSAPATTKLTPTAALQQITTILQQESHRIGSDPILKFVQELYCNFNFEAAQQELKKAQEVARHDFFIGDHADAFIESARFLVSEAYCRIHQRVDIADLSNRLNMTQEEGEKWIVNLIRDTKADAKIDFKEGMVHMNQTNSAIYQTVIERTRGFTFRQQPWAKPWTVSTSHHGRAKQ